jgi:hypothetical protein
MYHFFGIICLNPYKEGGCFVQYFLGTIRSGDKYQNFSNYLTEDYIDSESLFPPNLGEFLSSSLQLTMNICQSSHSY